MNGTPLLLDLVARTIQEERLAEARRERLAASARIDGEGSLRTAAAALRRALTSAGRRLADLRAAASTR